MSFSPKKLWKSWLESYDNEHVANSCKPGPTMLAVSTFVAAILAFRYIPFQTGVPVLENALAVFLVLLGGAASLGTWLAGPNRKSLVGFFQIVDLIGYAGALVCCAAHSIPAASHGFAGMFALACIYWGTQFGISLIGAGLILSIPMPFVIAGLIGPVSGVLVGFGSILFISMAIRTSHIRKQQARIVRVEDVLSKFGELLENQTSAISSDLYINIGTLVHQMKNDLVAASWDLQDANEVNHDNQSVKKLVSCSEKNVSSVVREMEEFLDKLKFDKREQPTFWLHEIVENLTEAYGAMSEDRRLVFDDIPHSQIAGAGDLIQMALVNLIDNSFEAGARAVFVRGELMSKGRLLITVKDDGPGLPDEIQKNIFKPYNTLDKEHGVGLGIFLTSRVVKSAGGSINLVKTTSDGTRFDIILPLVDASADVRDRKNLSS
jgi:signal transduction histidine kinase